METFTLSRKELHRPGLLKALCGGRLTNAQVAAALRITVRQVRRLKRRFEAGGPGALVHGNRDRPSPRRLPAAVRDAVVRLMTTVYVGFNDTHLTEKLREHHALGISRETVRRYREQLGHPPKRARRAPRVRRRRVPSAARGALIQIDGSPFPWLEDRGPELMLLGAIDDATSEILALQFRPAEDVHGYVTLFRDVFTAHGLPMAVYGDRLNLLVRNDAHWSVEEQLAGTQAPTHVGRILQNLAIGYIAARSPQAKGRIERAAVEYAAGPPGQRTAPARHSHRRGRAGLPGRVHHRLQSALRETARRPPGGVAPAAARSRPPPRLRLPPRGRPRQHRAPRASRGVAPWRALLRQADGRRARTARWPGRRPARRGHPWRGAVARPHVHPQTTPRAERRPPPASRRSRSAAAAALATAGPQHAHWPSTARHPSLAARAGGRDS